MSKKRNFEIRDEEVNDILERSPNWMVRSGSLIMLCLVVLLVVLSAIIKYPEIINAPVVLTAKNMPVELKSKKSGRIEKIFVENGSIVKKGDVIALLESTTDYLEYNKLQETLLNFILDEPSPILPLLSNLGSIQESYSRFIKATTEYNSFKELDYYGQMTNSLLAEKEIKEGQLQLSNERLKIAKEQYRLAEVKIKRERDLFISKVISAQEMESSEAQWLSSKLKVEELKNEVAKIGAEQIDVSQNLLSVEREYKESCKRFERERDASYSQLLSDMKFWEEQTLFISPEEGMITFTNYWQANQNVMLSESVFTIIPSNERQISGKLFLPLRGAGKVREGQRVNIKLDGYPYLEFGTLKAKVESISLLPANWNGSKVYIATIELPEGLITTYGSAIKFVEEMHGVAEVITLESSLLSRIINPLRYFVNKHYD